MFPFELAQVKGVLMLGLVVPVLHEVVELLVISLKVDVILELTILDLVLE